MPLYEITLDGVVGPLVTDALEEFEVRATAAGRTTLVGDVVDQSALHGVFERLSDVGAVIVEVRRVAEAPG